MSNIKILGVKIDKVTLDGALDKVKSYLKGNSSRSIYTPNTEIVMEAKENESLKKIINEGDLVIADGIGLVYASRLKKKRLPERVTGFDLSMKILKLASDEGYSLFLLGGKDGIAKEASENIVKTFPKLRVAGYHHGFFKGTHIGYKDNDEEKEVIDKINTSGADILFVGFGAPKQEKWIHENKGKLRCKVIIGNGGTVDILAGRVKRAPQIYQKLGLEWLYRLAKEPKRIKRQLALPLFVLIVLFSKDDVIK